MSTQTDNGRAFEWAVGTALEKQTGFAIEKNAFSSNAKLAFAAVSEKKQATFTAAAEIAVQHILNKEILFVQSGADGSIKFNSDQAGSAGDVRDVLLTVNGKTLGISCKNNHQALKHSRLSGTVNFVKKWGIDSEGCSADYWQAATPLFDELKKIKKGSDGTALWSDMDDKAQRFYWPILDAWADELQRICHISTAKQAELCKAIISYLVGKHDFYKVICEGSTNVQIQAWNFNKTLATKRTKYPDCINAINNKNGGLYSKTLVFNHGYSINFRIHSASSRVEPSLKFDINAIGLPSSEVYQQTLDLPK
ncbi:MAG: HaeIII family restriction endonuclease [Sideroxydans sp.]|nr:HaeIII family restriction endonuclease [Sideroxydans sp.]